MNKSRIEWCDMTWNPVTGCYHDCEYCYAKRMIKRFHPEATLSERGLGYNIHSIPKPITDKAGKTIPYPIGMEPTFHWYRLKEPARKMKPQTIFVCSMADLFGDWVPDEWIGEVFKACEAAPQHRYLFLTKNPKRYLDLKTKGALLVRGGFWFGSTVTTPHDPAWYNRSFLDEEKKYVSIEPILAPFIVESVYDYPKEFAQLFDWVIVGAETGTRKDKIVPKREWIEQIVTGCKSANTPLFMKNSLADIWGEPLIQEFPWEVSE